MTRSPRTPVRLPKVWLAVALAVAAVTPITALAPAQHAAAYTTIVYNGAGDAPHIGLIGDSTLAAIRWYGLYGDLYEYNFVYDAESCRRTIYTSCRGREGYAPENAFQVMRRLDGRWGRVLVMMTGYDDPGYDFDNGVDAIVAEAKRQGIPKVMWLTLRTADVTYVSPEYRSDSYTFRDNNRILLAKAVQYRGYLQIADWATYSAQQSGWFASDGIHMSSSGALALAAYINDQAGMVIAGQTVTPPPNPRVSTWVPLRKGDYGSRVTRVQRELIERGIDIPGGADGVFGTYTERAVMTFQQRQGLNVTGVVNDRTAVRLGVWKRPPPIGSLDCRATVPLTEGDRLNQATCLERHLAVRGYRVGIDNLYGSWTAEAISYFKSVSGLRADGKAGPRVYRALGIYRGRPDSPSCSVWRTHRPGERLPSVRCLKGHLRARGYTLEDGASYGDAVRLAVRHFQRHQRLKVSGAADHDTLHRLGVYRDPPDRPGCMVSRSLYPGDRNADVLCFERHLRSRGFGIKANDLFDNNVAMVVKHLKGQFGLRVNGIAGPALLRAMRIYADETARTPSTPPESTTSTTTTTTTTTTLAPVPPTTTTTTVATGTTTSVTSAPSTTPAATTTPSTESSVVDATAPTPSTAEDAESSSPTSTP